MAYRLKPGRPLDDEVRRIAETQCKLALAALRGVGTRADDKTTHDARRHIKKAHALADLFQSSLARSCRPVTRRLRRVSRLLAPVADGEAVVDTVARMGKKYRGALPKQTVDRIQKGLVQLEFHADRKATFRVKDLWLQMRLIQERCGDQLAAEEEQLDRLDGHLGEYHNCVVLADVLTAAPLAPRQGTAQCLRLVRRYQEELRRELRPLAIEVLAAKPRRFVDRARQLWGLANQHRPTTARRAWRHVA